MKSWQSKTLGITLAVAAGIALAQVPAAPPAQSFKIDGAANKAQKALKIDGAAQKALKIDGAAGKHAPPPAGSQAQKVERK
jgi:hypothetical protein